MATAVPVSGLTGAMGPMTAMAAGSLIFDNESEEIVTKTVPKGKIGRSMNVNFVIRNTSGVDWKDVKVGIADRDFSMSRPDAIDGDYVFPFEITENTFKQTLVGTVRHEEGKNEKNVSLTARVRADLPEGYYSVTVEVEYGINDNRVTIPGEVLIWVTKPGANDKDNDPDRQISFTLGEGQATPYGDYPNVMDFAINMRNSGISEARDVTASMVLSKDSNEFPFAINEGNYDRKYEKIAAGETVSMPYSFAIRSDAYTGYYPLKFEITYRETATGDLQKIEEEFWVHVKNKEKEDTSKDFNENDRTKARLVVDSFETIPKDIVAGENFQLILRMKNASSSIGASNILFSLESEKVSDSAVFTTASGSSSVVVNSLGAGEVTELKIDMQSKAGIDQRSYALNIKETYDSPEFKNASETVSIDIPLKQIARLNTGTIEVMPSSMEVGNESNIMFPINNTGRVILYNVTVAFQADSIVPTDTYVGNIKPGETGNVDVMVTGAAATTDDGKVKILITYEDENGIQQEPIEKELNLYVTEPMDYSDMDMDAGNFDDTVDQEPAGIQKYLKFIIPAAAVLAVAAITVVVVKKKKKKASQEEDVDDEIS
ncbi:MAG: hypothetical protein MR311_00735 [Lachnospiraceae bacterium]|nr:hypothetical protein [Lachnospiraceae bacterium]